MRFCHFCSFLKQNIGRFIKQSKILLAYNQLYASWEKKYNSLTFEVYILVIL